MHNQTTLLQINTTVNYGSNGRIAEEIGLTAMAHGWESYIAFGRHERPSASRLLKVGKDLDIALHGLQTRLFDRHGLGSALATRELIKKINLIQPDIIQLHNIHGYYLNYKLLFHYLASVDIPVVWTLHDCWPFTGHCANFSFAGCDKWKTVCEYCPQTSSYPASLLIDRSRKNFQDKKNTFLKIKRLSIVCVSGWLAQMVGSSFLNGFPVKVIQNGINTDVFSPVLHDDGIRKKYRLGDKFVILGVAGYWNEKKGLHDFLSLGQQIDEESQIVLVGLSKKQLARLPKNIIGIERTDNLEELTALYSTADVFVNPSYEESFGLTTIEAMACGTPSIVYDATALPETITPETGVVVKSGDLEGLKNAIEEVKRKGKSPYIKACRDRALTHFKSEDRTNDYIRHYISLLNNSIK